MLPTGICGRLNQKMGLNRSRRPRFRANNGDTCRAAALDHQSHLATSFLIGDDLAARPTHADTAAAPWAGLGIYAYLSVAQVSLGKSTGLDLTSWP